MVELQASLTLNCTKHDLKCEVQSGIHYKISWTRYCQSLASCFRSLGNDHSPGSYGARTCKKKKKKTKTSSKTTVELKKKSASQNYVHYKTTNYFSINLYTLMGGEFWVNE